MRNSILWMGILAFMSCSSALAQRGAPPGGGLNAPPTPVGDITGYMSSADVKGLADFVDNTRRLERKDLVSKTLASKRSTVMLDALHIDCKLADAEHLASGKTGGSNPVSVGLYEVACTNGMGYLLTLMGLSSASAISCFAASATQPAAANPANVQLKCQLPANQDLNVMATAVMRNAGTACEVHGLQWLGQGAAPATDYTEVACNDGQGFVLRTPAPGSPGAIDVLNCSEAARHGAQCKLSAAVVAAAATTAAQGSATPAVEKRPDLQWFKDALSKNGVSCDVKKARVVGRESVKRRYVVEYQCPQQPRGLVAYVPSAGDAVNAFESMDCDAAAGRKIACQFVAAR